VVQGIQRLKVAESAYTTYIGVDISEEALAKAEKRSKQCGRQAKNSFACSDFLNYVPTGQFDVILFRESVYPHPHGENKVHARSLCALFERQRGIHCPLVRRRS
jgi:SAM-dependent methyltransferase